jgi:small-conductance mechanosensitive channel
MPEPVLAVAIDRLIDQYSAWAVSAATFLGVLLGAYLLGRLVVAPPLVRAVRARNRNNPTLVNAVALYVRLLLLVVAVPVAIAAAGFGGIAAGSGVVVAAATLAVGVAGQDVIGNLVSGVFLVVDPEFNVDDYIEWGDQSGTVERISLRTTRVRTVANETITVPNNELTTLSVRRPFVRDRYRLSETFAVAYDDIEAATDVLADAATADGRVLEDPEPRVEASPAGSAVDLTVFFWVPDPGNADLVDVRTAFVARATDRLGAAGITVAPAAGRELSGRLTVDRGDGRAGPPGPT